VWRHQPLAGHLEATRAIVAALEFCPASRARAMLAANLVVQGGKTMRPRMGARRRMENA
jgi:hypothetical protein